MGPDHFYEKSDMAPENELTQPAAPVRKSILPRSKYVLLVIEVVAVIGLLAGAVHMWNVRQELQQDLTVAKEVNATIKAGEQTSGTGGQTGDARDVQAESVGTSSANGDWRAPLPARSENGDGSGWQFPASLWDVALGSR